MSESTPKPLNDILDLLEEIVKISDHTSNSIPANSTSGRSVKLSGSQIKSLLKEITPYIYGETPMCQALNSAAATFASNPHQSKSLLIISDGDPTDGDPLPTATALCQMGVKIVTCLLTSDHISQPRRLYDTADPQWPSGHRRLFEMSSTIPNSTNAIAVLLQRGWTLPTSGVSRLFVQANNPDIVDEFAELVRQLSESTDALADLVGRIQMDVLINTKNIGFRPNDQVGGTCYANAIAAVFYLAMSRIEGRQGGVPEFTAICDALIKRYGPDGAYAEQVMTQQCPLYRLRFRSVDEIGARTAINHRRPLVACFGLTRTQWQKFSQFFKTNHTGILKKSDLLVSPQSSWTSNLEGHAVVLSRCDPYSLTFINSWGTNFADGGYFKVQDSSTLGLRYYDVYWLEIDLVDTERQAFRDKNLASVSNITNQL
jgi:hypothetical protein